MEPDPIGLARIDVPLAVAAEEPPANSAVELLERALEPLVRLLVGTAVGVLETLAAAEGADAQAPSQLPALPPMADLVVGAGTGLFRLASRGVQGISTG